MPVKKNYVGHTKYKTNNHFHSVTCFLLNFQWLLAVHRHGKYQVYLGLLFTVHADRPSH